MIEPLRYHIEKNPPHAIKKAVFCERCLSNKKLKFNPQLATKYCAQCSRFHYLCKGCEDYLHSFVKTKDHVRLIVVIGPAVRKKIMKRGNAKTFPKLFDIVEVQFKTAVVNNGQVKHREPVQLLKFPSGVSGTCVHIQILGGKKLPISDAHGTSDPFVCISFGGNKLGTTRTRPRTINPRWTNETYVIPVDDMAAVHNTAEKKNSKQRELIKLEVFDRDYWNFNDFLGHVEVTRQQLLKLAEHSNCKPIRLNLTLREYHGCLGLKAGISADIFNLKFDKAEDLDRMDAVGLSDPYCVLYFCNKIVGKTPRIDNTLNPVWTTGNVMSLPIIDVLREERRLRLFAAHGLTSTGPSLRDMLDKAYIFTIQMYDHNNFRADGLLGTVRINVEQLRKLCPNLPKKEEDIEVGTSLAHKLKNRRLSMNSAGSGVGVGRRLRHSISMAAGSLSFSGSSKDKDTSSSTSSSAFESQPQSQSGVASASLVSGVSGPGFGSSSSSSSGSSCSSQGSNLADDESQGNSVSRSELSTATAGQQPQPNNNQLEDVDLSLQPPVMKSPKNKEAVAESEVEAEERQEDDEEDDGLKDDMGDDNGGSDDGSVYRRPKSPAFDINPDDEIEANTFNDLHLPIIPRDNNDTPHLGMLRTNRAMTHLSLRNLDLPPSITEKSRLLAEEDLTDEEDDKEDERDGEGEGEKKNEGEGEGEGEGEMGDKNAGGKEEKNLEERGEVGLSHSRRVMLDAEEAHRRDKYLTDERFFADRKLERLESALDGNRLLAEYSGSDDEYDFEQETAEGEGSQSQVELAEVFENEPDARPKGRRKSKGSSVQSHGRDEEDEDDDEDIFASSDDEDDYSGDDDDEEEDEDGQEQESQARGDRDTRSERGSDNNSEESGVYEEREPESDGEGLKKSTSFVGSFRQALQRSFSRSNSMSMKESLRLKREQLALSLKGPQTTWGHLKFFDVEKDAVQNVTDAHREDRGQLILRLIKSSRGHVIRGLDVGVRHMTLGETSQLKVRYDYGYGNFWMGAKIPPRSNLRITCKLVSINGGSGVKLWRQWLRWFRMMRRTARETRRAVTIGCASCFAFLGLLRERYRLYKNPPYESDSEDEDESSEEESSVSSDSEESDDDTFANDPYLTKVEINDSNRALYAGADAMWGYKPNKPKFIPYDPKRRAELQKREEKRLAREARQADKKARREAKALRKLKKSGLLDSDSEDEASGMSKKSRGWEDGQAGSQQDEMSSRSGASGSNRSSSSRQGFLSKRSGGSQSQQSQSQRSQLQLQLQTQTSQGSGLSRASSGISGAGSGISGLVSEGEQSEQSGVPSKTKDD